MSKNSATCKINIRKQSNISQQDEFELSHNLGSFASMLASKVVSQPQIKNPNEFEVQFITDYRALSAIHNYVYCTLNLDKDYEINIEMKRLNDGRQKIT